MKEIKDTFLKMRVTASEKERIKEYCEQHDLTISELLRMAINRMIALEKEGK